LLLIRIDNIVNDKNREDLIIFEHHILMLEDLRILFLIVKVNRLKTLRAGNRVIQKFVLAVTVRFTD
jgi:hypothetical protein